MTDEDSVYDFGATLHLEIDAKASLKQVKKEINKLFDYEREQAIKMATELFERKLTKIERSWESDK